jgi:tetratricopeptide (TPR) repeat protein
MAAALLLTVAGAQAAPASPAPATVLAPAVHTSTVVDSNSTLFAVLAALNAAGYDAGLTPAAGAAADTISAAALRQAIRQHMSAPNVPVLPQLRAFYQTHHLANPSQDLAQYVDLALFLGNPPGLTLTIPRAGLPPNATEVADVLPLLQQFYSQANLAAIWQDVQPQYEQALAQDTVLARATLSSVDNFFRIPQDYSPRRFYIFPGPMMAPGESDALNYEDNYYFATNLALSGQIHQLRHTYLHFELDPLIAQYPAVITGVEQEILPAVAAAPGLGLQFKRDPELFYTECLVRAVELQLDPGTPLQKQAEVEAAMNQGLVLTSFWYQQLSTYRNEPENFAEFYPTAAFAAQMAVIGAQARHRKFSPAPAASDDVQPTRVASLLDRGQQQLDGGHLDAAATLAGAALKQPDADHAAAYFLLGKVAAERNQAQTAVTSFQNALAHSAPADTHVRTWSNIYLGRLFDAEDQRAEAVRHYQAALASADTPQSKALAAAGIKAPFHPSAPSTPAPPVPTPAPSPAAPR